MIKFEWRGDSEVSSPIFGNPCSGLLQQCKQIWTIHLRVGKASRENWGCWVWQSLYLNLCGGPQNMWIMPKKCNGSFISLFSDEIIWHDRKGLTLDLRDLNFLEFRLSLSTETTDSWHPRLILWKIAPSLNFECQIFWDSLKYLSFQQSQRKISNYDRKQIDPRMGGRVTVTRHIFREKMMLHLHRQYRHKKDQISAATCSCCSCPHHIWAESGQEQPSAKSSLQKPRNIIESMQCNWITFTRRVCLQNCSLAAFVFFHYFPFVFRLSLSNVFPGCFLVKHFSTKLPYSSFTISKCPSELIS